MGVRRVTGLDREGLIAWLQREDPNGIWSDEECEDLLGAPMTLEQARAHVDEILAEYNEEA